MPTETSSVVKTTIQFARRLEKIPSRFYQTGAQRPFKHCGICGQELFDPTLRYMINKFYSEGELEHELVVCSDCQEALQTQYSSDSQTFLDSLLQRVDLAERYRLVFNNYTDRVKRMISYCILCRSSRLALRDYFEYAECQSDRLLISLHPTLICSDCARGIYESLSPVTREIRRRFFEPYFGAPPISGKKLERQSERILHPMV